MPGPQQRNSATCTPGDRIIDFFVTITCWAFFTIGFLLFFAPRYLVAYSFASKREISFQRLTSLFYRRFFQLLRRLAPRQQWDIDPEITTLSSAVIVCNHVSYLDPILLISLLTRQKTLVKARFFQVPIFSWFIRNTGYIPADGQGDLAGVMIDQVEQMTTYLGGGGNLFIFPEGTRSRDGQIAPIHRGALKIARLCRAPILILYISGTEKLFTPGKFLFNTRTPNTIQLRIVDHINMPSEGKLSLDELENRIKRAFMSSKQQNLINDTTVGSLNLNQETVT